MKTPEQILEEIKKWFEKVEIEWSNHLIYLSKKKKEKQTDVNFDASSKENFLLFLRTRGDSKIPEKVEKVLEWIKEAIARNEIEGWKELYTKWNEDPDIKGEDIVWCLANLRDFLEKWENASYQQKTLDILQIVGIDPNDENARKKAEELRKIIDNAEKNQKFIDLFKKELIGIKGEELVAQIEVLLVNNKKS